jgi:hypothetical protein
MIKEQEKIDKAQKELDEIKRKYAKEQENFDKAKNALDKAQNDEIESKKSLKQAEMALRNVKEGVWKKGYDLASTGENYKNAKNAYKENPTSEALNKQEETLQIFKKARDEQVNQIKLTEQQKEREESAVKDAKNSSITALRDKNNAYQALQKAKGKLDLAQEKKAQKAKDEAIAEQDKIKQKAQKEYDKLKKEYEKYEAIEKEKEELARINKDIKTINGALAAYKAYREKHEPLSKKTCPPLPDPLPPSVPKLLNPPPPKPAEPEKKPQKPANTGEGEAAGSGTGGSPPEQGTSGGEAVKKEPCPNQDQREDLQDAIKKIADELKTALFDLPTQQGGRKRELEERKKRAGKSSGEQSSQTGPMFDTEVKTLSETVDNLNQSLLSKETATSSSSDLLSKLNDAMVSFAKSSVVIDKALSDKDKATGDPALALQSAKAKLQELWNLLSAEWEKIHKDCQEQGALTPPSLEDSTQREGPSGDTTSPTGTSGGEAVKKEPCPSIGDRLALEKAREEIQKLGEAFNKKLAFDIFDIDEIKERDINKIDETIAGIQRAQDENIKGYRKTKDQRFIDEVKKQASLIENEKAKKEKILQVSEVAKAYSNAIKELEQAVSDSSLSIFEQYVAFKKYDENEKNIVDALRKAAALVDETWLTLHDKLQEETYKQLELLKTYRAALMKCPEIENLLLPPTPPSTEGPEGVSAGEQTPAPLTRVEVPQEKDLIQKILDKTLALFGKKPTEPKKIICEIPSIDICSSKASKEEMVKQYQDYLKKAPPECSSYIKEELEKKKEALEKEAKGKQEEKVN